MVTMNAVWDRTTEILSGRASMLAGIAVPTLLLPPIVRDAYVAYTGPASAGVAVIGAVLSIIVLLLSLWGQLAIIAACSDPATHRSAAARIATGRLLPAIGVSVVMLMALVVTLLPAFGLLAGAGVDFAGMTRGVRPDMSVMNGGALAGAILYLFAWGIALLFVGARLTCWQPVLVNERNGLRAIVRSWQVTRGATWRIVGVLLLFAIVLLVAAGAAQSVVGLIFRVILGAGNIATALFLGMVAGAVVTTIFSVLATAFITQLYVALAGDRRPAA
jgi:hypothetical protein